MRISENFVLNVARDFNIRGDFFRIETAVSAIDVDFYRGGQILPENLRSASAGYWANPEGGFDRVVITSQATQAVAVDVYRGRVGADRVAGSVQVSNNPLNVAQVSYNTLSQQAVVAVGVANLQVAAADANRRRIVFMADPANAGDIYLGSATTTTANGALRLAPGDTWVEDVAAASEWRAIATVAAQTLRVLDYR